jgi:peroxiredoxin
MKALLLSVVFAAAASAADQPAPPVLAIGAPVPAFSLPDLEGKTRTLSDYADSKILCIIFTCNHCPDAVAAAPRIQELYQDYKGKGVAVVAVNSNNSIGLQPDELGYSAYGDSVPEMKPFAKDNGWELPYLYDGATQSFATACGAQSTPHVFVFDSERKLRYTGRMDDASRKKGHMDKSYVRDALDAMLAGKDVPAPVTRSFGCSTKWLWKKDNVAIDEKKWQDTPVTLGKLDVETAKKLRANPSGNVRLINFWSTSCGPCVEEFPELVDTYRRFQSRDFDFVSISLDPPADEAKVQKFLAKQHAALSDHTKDALAKEARATNNYVFAGDNPDQLAEAIDKDWTGAQPHSVLLSPKGEILWHHTGKIDVVELRKEMLKALEGMP